MLSILPIMVSSSCSQISFTLRHRRPHPRLCLMFLLLRCQPSGFNKSHFSHPPTLLFSAATILFRSTSVKALFAGTLSIVDLSVFSITSSTGCPYRFVELAYQPTAHRTGCTKTLNPLNSSISFLADWATLIDCPISSHSVWCLPHQRMVFPSYLTSGLPFPGFV